LEKLADKPFRASCSCS